MIDFFTYFAFTQMLTSALLLFPHRKQNPSIVWYMFFMISGASYLLGDIVTTAQTHSTIWWLENIGGNALPGLFWLVSLSVFGDHVRLKKWQYIVASISLLISLLVQLILFISKAPFDPAFSTALKYTLISIELGLIGHALITAFKYWRNDLVQERRYIRGGVITLSALYIFLVIIVEQLLNMGSYSLTLIKVGSLALLVTGINYFLFCLRPSSLFETIEYPVKNSTLTEDTVQPTSSQKDFQCIIDMMEKEKFYQQEGATISSLAKQVTMQEYKLRQLINGEMNFRNFNDFLNFYRVKEITQKLNQASLSNIPVLTFALESGFRSLSTFNKAFKETHGMTPTEYRKNKISD